MMTIQERLTIAKSQARCFQETSKLWQKRFERIKLHLERGDLYPMTEAGKKLADEIKSTGIKTEGEANGENTVDARASKSKSIRRKRS